MGAGTSAGKYGARKRSKAAAMREQGQRLIERADGLDRVAEHWERGEQGERVVGAALDALQSQGWVVMHDVRWPGRQRANIDHVAIGPPGVLVVDAKNWSGDVAIRGGHLRQNGYRRDKVVDAVAAAGDDVGGLLNLPWALHVIPVLCLVEPFGGGPTNLGPVTVVAVADLQGWAANLTPRLASGDVLGLGAHLRASLTPASLPAPRLPSSSAYAAPAVPRERAYRPSRSHRSRSKQVRRGLQPSSGLSKLLIRLAVVAALVLAGPWALKVWLARGDDLVRQVMPTLSPSAAAPQAAVFDRCRDLRVAYPAGLRAPGDRNEGAKLKERPAIDGAVATANRALDRDGDGLLCERVLRKVNNR